VLEEIAAENPNAKVVKIDVDRSPSLAAEYGVQSIPSLMVFKNGQLVDQAVGLVSTGRLHAMLAR
jgi:thioredoxin 1